MSNAKSYPTGIRGARADVLEFYRHMPFNQHETPEEEAKRAAKLDIVGTYPILERFLRPHTHVLEAGCGTGWLSNAIALHRQCDVVGIDFNPVAIKRSQQVAALLNGPAQFTVADIFTYVPEQPFRFVISLGVLHHTDDCLGALRHLCRHCVKPGGHLFVGLYHRHGRKPFLDHFRMLAEKGASEDAMLAEYQRLHSQLDDPAHIVSWFRDQVLHPHETQHTLEEIVPVLEQEHMELRASSINGFGKFATREELFALEPGLELEGQRQLEMGHYYPGFFLFLARKTG